MPCIRHIHCKRAFCANLHRTDISHSHALWVEHLALKGRGRNGSIPNGYVDTVCTKLGGSILYPVEPWPGLCHDGGEVTTVWVCYHNYRGAISTHSVDIKNCLGVE